MQSHQSKEHYQVSVKRRESSDLAELCFKRDVKHLLVDLDQFESFQNAATIRNIPRSILELNASQALELLRILDQSRITEEGLKSFLLRAMCPRVPDMKLLDNYVKQIYRGNQKLVVPLIQWLQSATCSHAAAFNFAVHFILQQEDQLVLLNFASVLFANAGQNGIMARSVRVLDGASRTGGLACLLSDMVEEVFRVIPRDNRVPLTESFRADNFHLIVKDLDSATELGRAYQLSCHAAFINHTELCVESLRFRRLLSYCWESLERNGVLLIAHRNNLKSKGVIEESLKSLGANFCEYFPSIIFQATSQSGQALLAQLRRGVIGMDPNSEDENIVMAQERSLRESGKEQVWQHEMHLFLLKKTASAEAVSANLLRDESVIEISSSPNKKVSLKVEPPIDSKVRKDWSPDGDLRKRCRSPSDLTASEIRAILDLFEQHDVARYDQVLNRTLAILGIPRVLYYDWLGDEHLIRREAKRNRNESWVQAKVRLLSHCRRNN